MPTIAKRLHDIPEFVAPLTDVGWAFMPTIAQPTGTLG